MYSKLIFKKNAQNDMKWQYCHQELKKILEIHGYLTKNAEMTGTTTHNIIAATAMTDTIFLVFICYCFNIGMLLESM